MKCIEIGSKALEDQMNGVVGLVFVGNVADELGNGIVLF